MEGDKQFLMSLREEYLDEAHDKLNQVFNIINECDEVSNDCMQGCMSILHDLKGGAQVVGFLNLVKYLHDVESLLNEVNPLQISIASRRVFKDSCISLTNLLTEYISLLSSQQEVDRTSHGLDQWLFDINNLVSSFEPIESVADDLDDSWDMEPESTQRAVGSSDGKKVESSEDNRTVGGQAQMTDRAESEDSPKKWGFFSTEESNKAEIEQKESIDKIDGEVQVNEDRKPAKSVEEDSRASKTAPDDSPSWGLFEAKVKDADESEQDGKPSELKSAAWGLFEDEESMSKGSSGEAVASGAAGWGLFEADDDDEESIGSAVNAEDASMPEMALSPTSSSEAVKESLPPQLLSPTEFSKEQYLICSHNFQKYAIEVSLVREILDYTKVQNFPIPRVGYEGMIAVRGEVIPMLDLSAAIGLSPQTKLCTIICSKNDRTAGFKIEGTNQVMSISSDQLQDTSHQSGQDFDRTIRKIAKIDGDSILFLDLESLMFRS